MIFLFDEVVAGEFPGEKRPITQSTFMLVGLGVTWDVVPTTSENMTIKFMTVGNNIEHEILHRSIDPSTESLIAWNHIIPEGPIPLPEGFTAKVDYPNTDRNVVKVTYFGYWR